jgi:hypothetical protein
MLQYQEYYYYERGAVKRYINALSWE